MPSLPNYVEAHYVKTVTNIFCSFLQRLLWCGRDKCIERDAPITFTRRILLQGQSKSQNQASSSYYSEWTSQFKVPVPANHSSRMGKERVQRNVVPLLWNLGRTSSFFRVSTYFPSSKSRLIPGFPVSFFFKIFPKFHILIQTYINLPFYLDPPSKK